MFYYKLHRRYTHTHTHTHTHGSWKYQILFPSRRRQQPIVQHQKTGVQVSEPLCLANRLIRNSEVRPHGYLPPLQKTREEQGSKHVLKFGQWPFGKEKLLRASGAQNERIKMLITYLIPGHKDEVEVKILEYGPGVPRERRLWSQAGRTIITLRWSNPFFLFMVYSYNNSQK